MKFTVIIAEYNPLHNGHIYHLKKARELGNPVIVLMSGAFVQRGEPAILDKYKRAELSIHHGADAVFEIPVPFAFAPADKYAYGAFRMLDYIDGEVTLSFGSECGDIDMLYRTAKILIDEPIEYKTMIRRRLNEGYSFAKARQNALENYARFNNIEIADITTPNNILAIEYVKLNILADYKYTLITHKRIGDYKDNEVNDNFMSASAIRNKCPEWSAIQPYVPADTLDMLQNRLEKDFFSSLLYKIYNMSTEDLGKIYDMTEGFENRIKSKAKNAFDYDFYVDTLVCGHFSRARVKRILTCVFLNVTSDEFTKCLNEPPLFHILGLSMKSRFIMSKIKSHIFISQVELYNKRNYILQAKYTALSQQLYFLSNGDTLGRVRVVSPLDTDE